MGISRGGAVVGLFLFLLCSSIVWAQEPTYIGTRRCSPCHRKEFRSWEQTSMAKTFERLKAKEQGKAECLICHTTGYGKEGGFKNLEETPAMVGVQCEGCHGPGSNYFRAMKDKEKREAGGLWAQTEAMCKTCHNEKSPTFKGFKFDKNVGIHEHSKK